ncbi:oxysterol-binding protein-related protein 3-like isoform X2 [Ischnura elegans]|uniref:oxysterol-binding protein-related protein 3-like isoform X2 n=1 Tax=Ischnura elegans TaxID=197161 RepID=UPI001ED873C3|nr:oxysterol-binding protein-related protein 3-like isoform X2 [Ischnura elegans]
MSLGIRHIATEPANLSQKYFAMDKKKSPLLRNKTKSITGHTSDSECSVESNSLSAESNNELFTKTPTRATQGGRGKRDRRSSEWEILEGLRDGQRFEWKPNVFEGYLHKKRKWPLKGWHKRYFVLDKGILVYAKNPSGIARGKLHGSVDVGLSVVTTKEIRRRMDIDAEECIYHLKAKSSESFTRWVEMLRKHRLFRQHLLTYGERSMHQASVSPTAAYDQCRTSPKELTVTTSDFDSANTNALKSSPTPFSGSLSQNVEHLEPRESDIDAASTTTGGGPATNAVSGSPGERHLGKGAGGMLLGAGGGGSQLAAWVVDSAPPLEALARELALTRHNLHSLTRILASISSIPSNDTEGNWPKQVAGTECNSPSVKKDRRKFGLRRKKGSKGSAADLNLGSSPGGRPTPPPLTGTTPQPPQQMTPPLQSSAPPVAVNEVDTTIFTYSGVVTSASEGLHPLSSLSGSHPSLPSATLAVVRPISLSGTSSSPVPVPSSNIPSSTIPPASEHYLSLPSSSTGGSITPSDNQLREDYIILANDVHSSLWSLLRSLQSEQERLRQALEADAGALLAHSGAALVAGLRTSLAQALQQNAELRMRLGGEDSAAASDVVDSLQPGENNGVPLLHTPTASRSSLHQSLSYSSSEFHDAREYQNGDESDSTSSGATFSSEDEDDDAGSVTSENSDIGVVEYSSAMVVSHSSDKSPEAKVLCDRADQDSPCSEWTTVGTELEMLEGAPQYFYRERLPAPRPPLDGLPSVWNLLCQNIGKDLSKVSMPVALNEPLNMLQRLCEELEYSELLDAASEEKNPVERMVLVAAFAVSSYASSLSRAASKPFNPILGETYECVRPDRGFRFLAEQVSHHPPISACHAESPNFIFWQDARIKTKFWGKSMEFQPTGNVNVQLPRFGDHYRWNKVTTCVHNLFGGQRWVDQYGELRIQLVKGAGSYSCKLTFAKASYWSAKRHEVFGSIIDGHGKVLRKLHGKWSQGMFCGNTPNARNIWKPCPLPEDSELYYGFTRFAMSLNEMEYGQSDVIAPTDTRHRPDQRLLEQGDIAAAEEIKAQLEAQQRERRRQNEQEGKIHEPRWFRKVNGNGGSMEEVWETNHRYWEIRKNPGFKAIHFEPLW